MSLLTNLLVYYKMDEASGNALDSVASSNLTDNNTVGTATGIINTARSFNGTDEYFTYATNLLNGKSEYSISCWVQLTRGSAAFRGDTIFYSYDNGVGDGTYLQLDGTAGGAKLQLVKTIGYGSDKAVANSAIPLSTWVHVVGTVSAAGVITLYINGAAQTTTGSKNGSLSNNSTTYVGVDSSTNFWQGPIDELGLWDRELTSAEVTSLYNSGAGLAYPFTVTGIAFDAASNSGYQAAQSTYSWSHTCTGTNRFLAVDVSLLSAGQTVTSITYNGVPLLFIGAQSTVTSFGRTESWGLANPASGSNTIVVTLSGSIVSAAGAVSYANVHRLTPTANYNSAQATNVGAADATVNITTATTGSWVHAAVATSDSSITAGNTSRNNVTGAGGSGADEDTNAAVSPGTTAMSYTGVGALATWAIGGYELRPDTSISLFGRLVNVNQSVMNSVSF